MKKVLTIFSIVLLVFILCGCKKIVSNKTIIEYLNEKYNNEFYYVEDVSDGWPSKLEKKVFSDRNGNKCEVSRYYDSKALYDNCYSIIYDSEIENIIKKDFSSQYKVFVSTKDYATGDMEKYNNVSDYLNSIIYVRVVVCTTNSINIEEIQNKILIFARNNNVMKRVYTTVEILSMEDFLSAQNYESVKFMKALDHKNFTVENGGIK